MSHPMPPKCERGVQLIICKGRRRQQRLLFPRVQSASAVLNVIQTRRRQRRLHNPGVQSLSAVLHFVQNSQPSTKIATPGLQSASAALNSMPKLLTSIRLTQPGRSECKHYIDLCTNVIDFYEDHHSQSLRSASTVFNYVQTSSKSSQMAQPKASGV